MKKAISPVIATLLLILIAVAAAVLVYVWVTGYASSMTKAGAPELEERIKVEAVNATVGATQVVIYVRNIGNIATNITSAYIIRAHDNMVVGSNTTINNVRLTPGQLGEIIVSTSALEDGVTYIAKVVTKNGVEAALSFTPRSG